MMAIDPRVLDELMKEVRVAYLHADRLRIQVKRLVDAVRSGSQVVDGKMKGPASWYDLAESDGDDEEGRESEEAGGVDVGVAGVVIKRERMLP